MEHGFPRRGEKSNRGELGWAEVVLGSGHVELAYPRFGWDDILTGEEVGVVGWVLPLFPVDGSGRDQ